MSEPKFTQPPWRIRPQLKDGHIQRNFVEGADGKIVCEFWNGKADAMQIICVPEYYAVLDELVRKVGHDEDNLTALQILMRLNDIINRAEELLAKARGEVRE